MGMQRMDLHLCAHDVGIVREGPFLQRIVEDNVFSAVMDIIDNGLTNIGAFLQRHGLHHPGFIVDQHLRWLR